MKSGTNIERRGKSGTFYFRRGVPLDLRERFIVRSLRVSLRTNIRAEAVAMSRRLGVIADRLFTELRQGKHAMTPSIVLTRDIETAFKREMFATHIGIMDIFRDVEEGQISPEEAKMAARIAESLAEDCRNDLATNGAEWCGLMVPQEIDRQNLGFLPGSQAWLQLLRAGKQVLEQVHLAEARRYRGDYDDTPAYRALGLVPPSEMPIETALPVVLPELAKRPISVIYGECRADQIAHGKWKRSTAMSKDASVKIFRELSGDLRLDLITRENAVNFDRALREMPAMYGKSIYRGVTAQEAIKILKETVGRIEYDLRTGKISEKEAKRLLSEPKCRKMETHTRNKHVNALASIFTWARGKMKWTLEDHFAPFRLSKAARRAIPKKRIALKKDRLQQILQSPRFTGRRSATAWSQSVPGDIVVKDGLYWSVLLEAFHGTRLDEGAKLRTFDVCEYGAMWCLKLNYEGDEDGKGDTESGSGKTEASKRIVPMHSFLVKLGLPEYARRIAELHRAKGAPPEECWLFPELTVSKHHQTRAANLTKRWKTYLDATGLYVRWQDGHAFRHTFGNRLQRAGVPKVLVKELMGHARTDITEDTYFTPSTLEEMQEALEKLDYGLELEFRNGEWQLAKPDAP